MCCKGKRRVISLTSREKRKGTKEEEQRQSDARRMADDLHDAGIFGFALYIKDIIFGVCFFFNHDNGFHYGLKNSTKKKYNTSYESNP